MSKIIIINYGMGNLRSVYRAFDSLGAKPLITSNKNEIKDADKIILPGVGHFASGINKLMELKLWDSLNEAVLIRKTPILGICLGMQLMAKHSEEGDTEGLGWIDAEVVRFKIRDEIKYKVPHIGWNQIIPQKVNPLLNNLPKDAMYYFVHSYYLQCNNPEDLLADTEYEQPFTSVISKGNIFGTQFHPEKSHEQGRSLLLNFLKI